VRGGHDEERPKLGLRTDTLDASSAAPNPEAMRARATERSTHMIGIPEKVLPILTPEQRKIAAAKLRIMANSGADVPFGH